MPCESSFQLQGRCCFLISFCWEVCSVVDAFSFSSSFFVFIAWVTGFPSLTASAFFNKCCTWSLAVFFNKCCTRSLAVFFNKCCTWSLAVSLGFLRQVLAVWLLLVSSGRHAPHVGHSVPGPCRGPEKRTLSLSWPLAPQPGHGALCSGQPRCCRRSSGS